MVSFWPDSIWTPEFTDLATASPSPHRHLDGHGGGRRGRGADQDARGDQRRRHRPPPPRRCWPRRALTIDHLARGRFILGLGSGESENTVPVRFRLHQARSAASRRRCRSSACSGKATGRSTSPASSTRCTTPGWTPSRTQGRLPPIWIGASGPRMLDIAGRYADGWWPAGAWTPEHYAEMLAAVRTSADRAGRDPMAITPCLIQVCLIGRGRRRARRHRAGAAGQGLPAAGLRGDVARLRVRAPDGRGLARLPGHRPGHADPRADRRLPGPGTTPRCCWLSYRTARRSRSPKSSRRLSMPAYGYPRSSITARWRASDTPPLRQPMCAPTEDELLWLCGDLGDLRG